MSIDIPGLLEPKNSKMTKDEIQAMRTKFANQVKKPSPNNSIPDSMTASYQMTIDEIQKKFGDAIKPETYEALRQAQSKNTNGVWELMDQENEDTLKNLFMNGYGTGAADFLKFKQDWDYNRFVPGDQVLTPWDKNIGGYDLYKQRPMKDPSPFDMSQFEQLLKKPQKSAFEEIIDNLFDTSEKEQFLISVGYRFDKEYIWRDNPQDQGEVQRWDNNTGSLASLFLKEISIKFKNLLLMKATLKLKI